MTVVNFFTLKYIMLLSRRFLYTAFIFIGFLTESTSVTGQNFILQNGDYMDTTSVLNPQCSQFSSHYYKVQGKYPRSSATMLKDTQIFLRRTQRTYEGSGYITFRFVVDCEGNMLPRVRVLQTDDTYKFFHFNQSLVNDLYAYMKTLKHWKRAKTGKGEGLNYIAFLSFKLQNGKVVAIIP